MHSGNAKILGARGGRRRAVYNPQNLEPFAAPQSPMDVKLLLGTTMVELRAGKLEPRIANALACLATAFLGATDKAEFEQRLKALEERQDAVAAARARVQ